MELNDIELSTDTKHLLGDLLMNKKLHCYCNCLVHLDVIGIVQDYKIENNIETIIYLKVEGKNKLIPIGLMHPKMQIEILK